MYNFENIPAKPFALIRENVDNIEVRIYIPVTCKIDKRNFKRVFLKTLFFKLTSTISQDPVDRFTSYLKRIFSICTFIAGTRDS